MSAESEATKPNKRTLYWVAALASVTAFASLIASLAAEEASCRASMIAVGVRAAEIRVVCPVRSSNGVKNGIRCIMTVVEVCISVGKGSQGIVCRYETEMEIGGERLSRNCS